MDTLLRLNADDLNASLVDFIKSSFKGKKIAVHIYEEGEMDETEYLLSDSRHKKELLESIENIKQRKNLKTYTLEELKQSLLNEPEE
jgi:hypothetical protein